MLGVDLEVHYADRSQESDQAVFQEFASRVLLCVPSLTSKMRVNNTSFAFFPFSKEVTQCTGDASTCHSDCEMTANEIFLISNIRFYRSKWPVIAGCSGLIDL